MIGKRLLHYEIVEKLGQGGMGVVYKAYDKHLDRFVALKLLPLEQLMDASRKRRFIQEAKAASALNTPISLLCMTSLRKTGRTLLRWSTYPAKRWIGSSLATECRFSRR